MTTTTPTSTCSRPEHEPFRTADDGCRVCQLVDQAPPLGPTTKARLAMLLRPAVEAQLANRGNGQRKQGRRTA